MDNKDNKSTKNKPLAMIWAIVVFIVLYIILQFLIEFIGALILGPIFPDVNLNLGSISEILSIVIGIYASKKTYDLAIRIK